MPGEGGATAAAIEDPVHPTHGHALVDLAVLTAVHTGRRQVGVRRHGAAGEHAKHEYNRTHDLFHVGALPTHPANPA